MAPGTPRFMRQLPHRYITEGEYRYVELTRPEGPVRLYDFEYALALELDGRPYADIAREANAKLGMQIDAAQVEQFAASLVEFQLIEAPPVGAPGAGLAPARASSEGQWSAPQGEPTAMMQGMSELLAVATRPAPDSESELEALAEGARATVPETGVAPEAGAGVEDAPRAAQPVPIAPAGPEAAARVGADTGEPIAPAPAPPGRPGLGPELLAGLELPDPVGPLAGAMPAQAAPAPAARAGGPRWLLWAVLGLVAAAAAGFALWRFVLSEPDGGPVSVRTLTPLPESVYRFFPVSAPVTGPEPALVRAPGAGTVVEVRGAGSEVQAGELLALLEGGVPIQRELAALRERIVLLRQLASTLAADGDTAQLAQTEARLREKERLASEQESLLAQHALFAPEAGHVEAVLAPAGARVRAGQPVLRLLGRSSRAVFTLPSELRAEVARLSLCRVQSVTSPAAACDCRLEPLAADGDAPAAARAYLPTTCSLAVGTPVLLTRARLDGVFAVPARAVVHMGDSDRVFVAAPGGRSELRQVLLAEPAAGPGPDDRAAAHVLVAQGLDVGDAVIVEASAPLHPNARVRVTDRRLR